MNKNFLIKTWHLNIYLEGELVYAVESSKGVIRLLGNGHSGYTVLGCLSDLTDSEQESIKKLIIERFKNYEHK